MPSKILNSLYNSATYARARFLDRRAPLAYVGGWLGKQNLGDEALLVAYRLLFPGFNFVPYDGGRATREMVKHLPRMRAGMLGGGTLIGQKPIWLTIPRSFLKLRRHLVVFGTGVEEPSFWKGETTLDEWKQLLDLCGFIGVRGPRSAELLRDIGLSQVEVVGDPVLTFAAKEINRKPIPQTVGINFGTSDGAVWGDEGRIREELVAFAKLAKAAGWQVEWFVVWPKDMDVTRQAAEASGTAEHIHLICEDHEDFIRETRRLTAFVGMKLHATVLATCALTPSIMLEYRPKCRDYMDSIGQGQFTFKTSEFSAGELWEIISGWNLRRSEAAESLARCLHVRQAAQIAAAAKTAALIGSFRD
jgi:polysaccharide pyruvyl transferase WcaK-like protein